MISLVPKSFDRVEAGGPKGGEVTEDDPHHRREEISDEDNGPVEDKRHVHHHGYPEGTGKILMYWFPFLVTGVEKFSFPCDPLVRILKVGEKADHQTEVPASTLIQGASV